MMRAGFGWNNPREHYDGPARNVLGNPTRYESSSLVDGGVLAPRSAGSGAGDVFVNGQWQVNVNGVYQLPWDVGVAGTCSAVRATRIRSSSQPRSASMAACVCSFLRSSIRSGSTACGTSICAARRRSELIGSACSSWLISST